ncbi:NADP-dependent oxidoreductase [Achromobacter sp. F4_2707]|uniref:NADP-dependent oxidoreductase n=1 Tax=Achromobacter sp. F4_2707 TaxID=3114286 RepID=UPI0039C5B4F6
MEQNQRIILVERPDGMPDETHLKMETAAIAEPGEGQVLLKTIYLSLDPYMRGRMNAGPSYAPRVELGDVMVGGAVSQVVASKHPEWQAGDFVVTRSGWQSYAVVDGNRLRRVDPKLAAISTALGVLGMPGFTAYAGLLNIGKPQPGETVVVAAASGAVGQVVGQIAKLKGCRVVGVAGAEDKCKYVVDELGFDACVNYKSDDFPAQLAAACPDGIDVYFENVGGRVLSAVIGLLNDFSRMPVCGLIAQYNGTELPLEHNELPKLMRAVLTHRVLIRGFIQSDFQADFPQFLRDMSEWVRNGDVKYREDVVQGLENAVSAFQGLLVGRNRGKMLVQVAEDPSR